MRVIVLGAGVNGVLAAYYLAAKGHHVRVIERCAGVAMETTFANGGLLTPSLSAPWNAPGIAGKLLKYVGRDDAPLLLRFSATPQLAGWGVRFLRNAQEARFVESARRNTALAVHSLACLKELRKKISLDYAHSCGGVIKISRNRSTTLEHTAAAQTMAAFGVEQRLLSVDELINLEPALAPVRGELVSAAHYPDDEFGDAYKFTTEIFAEAQRLGVDFIFNTEIRSIRRNGYGIRVLESADDSYEADAYVVAAGSYSDSVLKKLNFPSRIRPVKGYSVSAPIHSWKNPPKLPVIDVDHQVVVTPIGSVLRIAGTAEFAAFDTTVAPRRIDNLQQLLNRLYPERFDCADENRNAVWTGLRAVSSDGVALIGRVGDGNVFTITGQGHNGWTMAAGSANLLADVITGDVPFLDPAHYAPNRFL